MTELLSAKVRAMKHRSHYCPSSAELWRGISADRAKVWPSKRWTSADCGPPRCPQNCSASQFYIAGLQLAFVTLISLLWTPQPVGQFFRTGCSSERAEALSVKDVLVKQQNVLSSSNLIPRHKTVAELPRGWIESAKRAEQRIRICE